MADENVATTDPAKSGDSSGFSLSGVVNGITSAIGSLLTTRAPKLPIPNPLFKYASYSYNMSIAALSIDDYNNPETSYISGKRLQNVICRTANADPNNRVKTVYGKFDFFIDNVEIYHLIGNEKGTHTNVTNLKFDIIEPYSMGLFMDTIQQAALSADKQNKNWNDAPFLLTIQFRGNTESGQIANVPNTTRHIPFTFTSVNARITGGGTVYTCEALPMHLIGANWKNSALKSDISITGKTVQEILQTGEKSLQAALNAKSQELVKKGAIAVADEFVILFPKVPDPNTAKKQGGDGGATVDPSQVLKTSKQLLDKIGVSKSSIGLLTQNPSDCNELGTSIMTFTPERRGDAPGGNEQKSYDSKSGILKRADNIVDYKESDFKFGQNSSVFNAINQVLLQSQFPGKAMDPNAITPEGYKGWWRIETQVYLKPDDGNDAITGERPKIIVYRVVPYNYHASKVAALNVQTYGFDNLKHTVVKSYDYIYTGKNVDIIKFDIEYNAAFYQHFAADAYANNQDIKTANNDGGGDAKKGQAEVKPLPAGSAASGKSGVQPGAVAYDQTKNRSDGIGGSGPDTVDTRAAKMTQDALTRGVERQVLNMEIIGDPYYIAQSGQGTYNATPVSANLNSDGTINYQSGEVDIIVNFRSPTDLNQVSGLYNIDRSNPGSKKSVPVLGFSGFYQILTVTSKFKGGAFTQDIEGLRREFQENPNKGTKEQVANNKTPFVGPPTAGEAAVARTNANILAAITANK